jgi:hypothetical protein
VLDELAPQQRRFNIFREEFNEERPHEALDQAAPAALREPNVNNVKRVGQVWQTEFLCSGPSYPKRQSHQPRLVEAGSYGFTGDGRPLPSGFSREASLTV